MAMNTPYLGTPSGATTVLSDLSISGALDVGNIDVQGTVAIGTTTVPLSFLTRANENDMTIGQLVLVQRASGLSLIYSSGDSIYELAESTVSAAQPTS